MESWEGSELNKAKEILAYELTKLLRPSDFEFTKPDLNTRVTTSMIPSVKSSAERAAVVRRMIKHLCFL